MAGDKARILIIDDDRSSVNILNEILKDKYHIKVALDGKTAIQRAQNAPQPDLILLDIQMPDMDGFEVLQALKKEPRSCDIPVIFLTAMTAEEDEIHGLELGAVDYITKPFSVAIVSARVKTQLFLQQSIREASEARLHANSLLQEVGALSHSLQSEELQQAQAFQHIITKSRSMYSIFRYMEMAAETSEPVLISGETGVGKELVAQAFHNLSGSPGELVCVNLAGLDDMAFSDTLFGHKRGAYTGADKDRKGLIAQATGGTLFLDEIGDLALTSQVKLLRVLQEGVYYPLGSDTAHKMNVRVIAATNRDLVTSMARKQFREDLFYRLAVHHVTMPPLRERLDDLPLLVEHFLSEVANSVHRKAPKVPSELIQLMQLYHFPGNIRELRAMIYNAMAQHGNGGILSMQSIKKTIEERMSNGRQEACVDGGNNEAGYVLRFKERFPTLEEVETILTKEALRQSNGNQGIAATLLGISRRALNRRLNSRLVDLYKSDFE